MTICKRPGCDRILKPIAADGYCSRYCRDIHRHETEHEYLKGIIAQLRQSISDLTAEKRGEVWYWQDDEYDHLESLTCPILIPADTLRRICTYRQDAQACHDELIRLKALQPSMPVTWIDTYVDMPKLNNTYTEPERDYVL